VAAEGFRHLLAADSTLTLAVLGDGATRRVFKFRHNLKWIDQLPKMCLLNLKLHVSMDGSL